MTIRNVLVTLGAVTLAACATSFQPLPADYNFGPPPKDTEPAIRAFFETRLFDADSARYQLGDVFAGQCNEGLLYGGGVSWAGWAQNIMINAKNRFGGYVGYQPYTVLFQGGQVVQEIDGTDFGFYSGGICRRVANPNMGSTGSSTSTD
jgi:hypothetical protein